MGYQCYNSAIVLDATASRILLQRTENGWALPGWRDEQWSWWSETEQVNARAGALLGLEVTTLRCLGNEYASDSTAEETRERRLYVLEGHDPAWQPPAGMRWAARAALADLPDLSDGQRSAVHAWLTHLESGAHVPPHAPWYAPGWLDEATAWVRQALKPHGLALAAPLAQLRTGQRGCVLRGHTAQGDVYFKALPSFFAHEVTLTQRLAARFPLNTVTLLAAETERHYLLMRDFGGAILETVPDVARWEEAMRRYAALQLDYVGRGDELLALGCPDRRPEGLAARIVPLLAATTAMTLPGRHGGLADDEMGRVRGLAPRLEQLCAELLDYGLPATLEHGDFYGQNVAVTEGGYVIFDWTDAGLAHPFFVMLPWLTDFETVLPGVPDARWRLRDAYLEAWTVYAPMERLIAAFELAQRLAGLYYALIQKAARDQMDAPWEMEMGVPFCLRMLLEHVSAAVSN